MTIIQKKISKLKIIKKKKTKWLIKMIYSLKIKKIFYKFFYFKINLF